ncbi:MAG: PD-(D/E)XK nuclease family protein [Candidatus Thermoplasmatota archaeon]|nr:PD-(D/E)XK nuclease family protein [Candidatus Thermoplasmatota archaeon]
MQLGEIISKIISALIANPYVALALFILFIATLYLIYRLLHRPAPLRYGEIIAADHSQWKPLEKPLFSKRLLCAGKPDYIVKEANGQIIPVEYKARRAPGQGPYKSHLLQLASYCALIEETYGTRPGYGVIAYTDKTFKIPYTDKLEQEMLELNEIVNKIERGEWGPPPLPKELSWFCNYCSQKDRCVGG